MNRARLELVGHRTCAPAAELELERIADERIADERIADERAPALAGLSSDDTKAVLELFESAVRFRR